MQECAAGSSAYEAVTSNNVADESCTGTASGSLVGMRRYLFPKTKTNEFENLGLNDKSLEWLQTD